MTTSRGGAAPTGCRSPTPAGTLNGLGLEPIEVMVQGGVEMGIKIDVRALYRTEAAEAFRAECDEVERFLRNTDTARH